MIAHHGWHVRNPYRRSNRNGNTNYYGEGAGISYYIVRGFKPPELTVIKAEFWAENREAEDAWYRNWQVIRYRKRNKEINDTPERVAFIFKRMGYAREVPDGSGG